MDYLKDKMIKFMQGRNGIDHLYIANLIIYFIGLVVIRQFEQKLYLNILLLLFIFWTFYRVFSRKIARRQAENQAFLRVSNVVTSTVQKYFKRIRDLGSHRYRRCPSCQTQLRLPRKVGTHTVRCPRCDNRFQVKVRL